MRTYRVTDKCNVLQELTDLLTNGHIKKKSIIQRLMKEGRHSKNDVKLSMCLGMMFEFLP